MQSKSKSKIGIAKFCLVRAPLGQRAIDHCSAMMPRVKPDRSDTKLTAYADRFVSDRSGFTRGIPQAPLWQRGDRSDTKRSAYAVSFVITRCFSKTLREQERAQKASPCPCPLLPPSGARLPPLGTNLNERSRIRFVKAW